MEEILITCYIFALLFIFVTSTSTKRDCSMSEELVGFDTSLSLKGLAILLVFIHHFGQRASETYYNHSFLGYLGVTIFFFLSGYVSEKQLIKKGKDSIGVEFFKKKILRLYFPYLLIILGFGVIGMHSLHDICSEILNIKQYWFLCAISIFYLIFAIANRISCKLYSPASTVRGGVLLLFAGFIIYILFCLITEAESVWYNTSIAFLIGSVGAYREKRLEAVKCYPYVMSFFSIVSIIFVTLSIFRVAYDFTSTIGSIMFSIALYCFVMKFSVKGEILLFYGAASWELYLCHTKVLSIIQDRYSSNFFIWFVLFFVISTIIGCVLHLIVSKIFTLWNSRRI